MNTTDFDYKLPIERIAQTSAQPRDHSRLMIVHKETRRIEERQFFDIVDYVRPGDLLVWNNSKVFKARLFGKLVSRDNEELLHHDKPVEIFLVRPLDNGGVWHVLAKPGKHVDHGMRVRFAPDFFCDIVTKKSDGTIVVQFPDDDTVVREKANKYGKIPIPPYVKDEPDQLEMYQTVYSKHEGSVAAPTAGFHFTDDVINALLQKGVESAEVTLHVGLGTFLPVKAERVEDHTMHSEWVELTEDAAQKINRAKQEGRRVIAVGTTTVRTLEGIAGFLHDESERSNMVVRPYRGELNIFITPGYEFRVIDALITNFHLPKSTLLMLVSAFVGDREFTF